MDVLGIIPAEGDARPTPTGALRTARGVPLLLWAINNLARALPLEQIVVITESPDVAAAARRAGARVARPSHDVDAHAVLVHDPLRPFCSEHTVRAALDCGERELAAMRVSPLERLRAETEADMELVRAVAQGLPPDHPCIIGLRALRAGLLPRAGISALISDVDGVLTNGELGMTSEGHSFRTFHFHDGMGVHLLHRAGVRVGWLSAAKDDGAVRRRAEMLKVAAVDIGEGDKGERFLRMCAALAVDPAATLYLGDDVNDLPAMKLAAHSACPSDARPEVRAFVDIVLDTPGGAGCFREAADLILDAAR